MTRHELQWIPRLVSLLLVAPAASFGQFQPASSSPFQAGPSPNSVAVGDFNGDGKLDLAIADASGVVVTVLRGDGNGGFTAFAGSPFTAGAGPYSVAVGDFNGDGKLDLAVLNNGGASVTILLGDGNGGFAEAKAKGSPFQVGSNPSAVAVGDFNGDGKLDLVTANWGGNNVTVLLGDGTGAFTPAPNSPFTAGISRPNSVAVGDFNGDGKADLAVANQIGDTVAVLQGDGYGGFTPVLGSPFPAGSDPSWVAVGDFNGDGKLDLAIANYYPTHAVTVLLGDGTGGFTTAPGSPFTVGTGPYFVAVGDFNGDGKPDLATANYGSNNVTVLLGDGTGAFTGATGSPFTAGTNPTSVAVGDFNGDGKRDLAIGNWNSNNVTALLNVFPTPPTLLSPSDGATGVSLNPTLSWSAWSGATSYDVYFGTPYPPPLATNTAGTAYGPPTLTAGTTYHWQVVGKKAGVTAGSLTWSFTTQVPAPPAPVLTSPANGATGVSLTPALSWSPSAGATSYDVYLGTANPPSFVANIAGTNYSSGTLASGATYYWQVVAKNGAGTAGSLTWSFTTQVPAPAAPALVSPANGATGVLVTPTLVWEASSGATSYDVHFGTASAPPLVINTAGTSYAPATLSPNTAYYWQIAARNASGSTGSAVWSFTSGVPAAGLRFVPVTPCRVVDTRNANGPLGGPTMTAGSSRSFAVPQSGCGIPGTALAYSMNVTVVPDGRLSYLTLWPTGQSQAMVSTLNSWGGIVVANAALVPAGTGGAVSVFVSDQTDVILDINGYFDTSSGPTSYAFYAATPCRIADTRGPTGQFGGPYMSGGQTRDFPIPLSGCGLPAAARGYSLNVTVVPGGYLGYLSMWPTGQAAPVASTLNSWTGKVVANAALVPAGTNESISVYVSDSTQVILDGNGYFAAPGSAGALNFYPVTPCRVADTRNPAGPFGGPEMGAGTTRSFGLPASACAVPSNAAAYSLNVTVVPDGRLSYLSAWATGSAQPDVSTLNSWDGAVVANAAIVPAGTGGAISIYVSDQTHVILDINGYFAP